MVETDVETDIQKQILRSLRDFYPIRVDDVVLVAAVRKAIADAMPEQIAVDITMLRGLGLIEESMAKTPFGEGETRRLRITAIGIERLQAIEEREPKGMVSPTEVEARLVETYDRIKSDMEAMRQSFEANQKIMEAETARVRGQIAEHDEIIRTYFVRIIETFGVFVGIFAVVVVILSNGNTAVSTINDPVVYIGFWVGIALTVVFVIMSLLLGIRYLVLTPPKPRK